MGGSAAKEHNMMRKILALWCVLLSMLVLCAQAEKVTIVHVTDTHYLSPALTDYGSGFMRVIEKADGKVTHYTPQLMQTFVDEMLRLQPEAVIISGDLTLNGAARSHVDLVELLHPLTEKGIQVLALPGNHDTNTAGYHFTGEAVRLVDGVPDEDFDDVYAALGYDQATARDSASMSYVAQLSPDVWCLLVDTNANGTVGTVLESTLAWVEEQLLAAQEAGATVIAVSHQPALIHNELFTFGYVINNNEALLALYEKYGVQLSLCGHLHMQHIARAGGVTEVAASSLAVSPNQYGILHIREGKLTSYEMQPLDVAGWAARTGQTDPNLLNFAAYAADFFDQTTKRQMEQYFADSELPPEDIRQLTEFAARLNAEYFSGARSTTADDPAWAMWETHQPTAFFTYYMRSILMEEPEDMRSITFAE